MASFINQLKDTCGHQAGVLEKPCSGPFESWLHAPPGKIRTSLKVKSYVTPHIRKIRNCKVLEVPLPGVPNSISGSMINTQQPCGIATQHGIDIFPGQIEVFYFLDQFPDPFRISIEVKWPIGAK